MDYLDRAEIRSAAPLTGAAAGVPYVALPPALAGGGSRQTPVVVAWHGLDPPRSQQAMAAALPLRRLAAWRVYLGLPLGGARVPARGTEPLGRLGADDVAGKLLGPMVEQAFTELPAVVAALRIKLPLDDAPIGLLGERVGAAVALLALAEGELPVRVAALVRPAAQRERAAAANDQRRDPADRWAEAAQTVAERLDVVAGAHQIAAQNPQPAVLLVTGADDDADIAEPAERLWHTLAGHYHDPGRVGLLVVPGLGQALAEEPGLDPAPQTPDAAQVDAAITNWMGRHLTK
jgi:hypothetical protein